MPMLRVNGTELYYEDTGERSRQTGSPQTLKNRILLENYYRSYPR